MKAPCQNHSSDTSTDLIQSFRFRFWNPDPKNWLLWISVQARGHHGLTTSGSSMMPNNPCLWDTHVPSISRKLVVGAVYIYICVYSVNLIYGGFLSHGRTPSYHPFFFCLLGDVPEPPIGLPGRRLTSTAPPVRSMARSIEHVPWSGSMGWMGGFTNKNEDIMGI